MPGELTMTSERSGEIHTLCVAGELDLATCDKVERELRRLEATDARRIVLDLSGLSFMDSTGVTLILRAEARSRADSLRLRLRRGPAHVQRVFTISGVADVLPFED